ncbi:hypothetical protein EMIHUDRAFT_206096 [Emiliania huxleyi CCMP1516]|uniref:Uncharacterized protein n=2 Tax=Emiliania huxleyi TaxID=2903 RepID=A0A0D3JQU9_EMIH1|nr:hypothetical protein EMIHUDRAFT_206096 [Emiliania huxleyi CCMP1516]EOD25884.1 hypothetical protein EMIHUDRAFT_206096 [Emiliania huxleyi CCMP1516]|eukprot:XP_005778313.1 hypothetical protein EMIHUDRAFT_206096 [Emiliania huxleyi CCMP1516]
MAVLLLLGGALDTLGGRKAASRETEYITRGCEPGSSSNVKSFSEPQACSDKPQLTGASAKPHTALKGASQQRAAAAVASSSSSAEWQRVEADPLA